MVWDLFARAMQLDPALLFAAGVLAATLVEAPIMVLIHVRAVRRDARRLTVPRAKSRHMWPELRQLRTDLKASAAELELGLARLQDSASERVRELREKSELVGELQGALAEKSSLLQSLVDEHTSLRLWENKLMAELRAAKNELSVHADALACAERTIAELKAELDRQRAAVAPDSGPSDARIHH